jgi:hypothetical protein
MERMMLFFTPKNGEQTTHPDEETLERFIMNRCREDELEVIEAHVIGCEACVERLETLEQELLDIKSGAALYLESLQKQETREKKPKTRWSFKFFAVPAFSMAAAAAAFVFATFVTPRDVTLSAYRGSEVAAVPQGHSLRLHLNARDLPAGPVTIEVVGDDGTETWKGNSTVAGDQAKVEIPAIRNPGEYLVRLEDKQGEVLREFAIRPE